MTRPSPTTPAARCTAPPPSSTELPGDRPRARPRRCWRSRAGSAAATPPRTRTNRLLATALPVNELAKVEQDMKLDAVVVPCAACFSRFKTGAHEVERRRRSAADVRAVVGRALRAAASACTTSSTCTTTRSASTRSRAKVTKPFDGLKVACYYGCLLTRPPKVTLAEDPEYPTHMDDVVEALGCDARAVELQDRLLRRPPRARRAGASWSSSSRSILADARACGAEAIVVRLPALPGQPRRPPGRHRAQAIPTGSASRCCTSASWSAAPSASTRGARPQEAPRRRLDGDGLARLPPLGGKGGHVKGPGRDRVPGPSA